MAAVIHAHPYYTLLCGITEQQFRPIVGGYAPGTAGIAIMGVPVYPRAATVTDKQMAKEMIEAMGERDLCLLKAHGVLVTGKTVQGALSLALELEHLAKITWDLASAGLHAPDISGADFERYDRRNPTGHAHPRIEAARQSPPRNADSWFGTSVVSNRRSASQAGSSTRKAEQGRHQERPRSREGGHQMRSRMRVGFLLLVVTVLAAGCASPRPTEGTQGGGERPSAPKRVIAAIHGDALSVYTRLVAGSAGAASGGQVLGSRILGPMVGAGLSIKDLAGENRPLLAEANPTLENGLWKISPDGKMETTWMIRDGAVWHDGAPITAEDMVFTTRVERDREMPWALPPQYRYVEDIEAPDSRTFTVRWNQTYIQADEFLQDQPLPKHILEAPYLDNKVTFLELPYWNAEYVGNGPFTVKQFALNSHVVLAAHDRYILGRPKIDEIEVKFINDGNTLLANLLAGTVEMALDRSVSLDYGMQVKEPVDRRTDGRRLRRLGQHVYPVSESRSSDHERRSFPARDTAFD